MEYRNLGRTGLKVSVLGYGAMCFGRQLDLPAAKRLLTVLKQSGVNLYDNAETYCKGQSEEVFGQAVRELEWEQKDYVVTTKLYFGVGDAKPTAKGLSRKHVVEGIQASLKRLGLPYVDLVYAHRHDPEVQMEEVVRAMNHIIDRGYCFYWGTSEWTAQQITHAWAVADRLGLVGPAFEQCQYNLIERSKMEQEYLPLFEHYGLGTTTWSPLMGGVLSGKYLDGFEQAGSEARGNSQAWSTMPGMQDWLKGLKGNFFKDEDHPYRRIGQLKPVAERLGCSMAQLALAWVVRNPHVSCCITGGTSEQQIEANTRCLEIVPKLTGEIMTELDDILGNKPKQ